MIEDRLREILQTPHENSMRATIMTFPTTKLLEQIIQAFKDEGWRVPQKPLDQEKAEELLEKLYWNTK